MIIHKINIVCFNEVILGAGFIYTLSQFSHYRKDFFCKLHKIYINKVCVKKHN